MMCPDGCWEKDRRGPKACDSCPYMKIERERSMTEFDKMVRLLDTSWLMRDQIVPCLVGPPGIGKTAAVMRHAKAHGSKVVKIVASRCVPSETVGMTMPDHEHHGMDILFLDELLEAEQFVLSTLLTVIESREMADGTPLPDIQIIAATNDTIPAEQLRDNIKQRFMFQRFSMDREQTASYINEITGMEVPDRLLSLLREKSDGGYNFITPRSLTKLFMWVDAAPEDKVDEVANVINDIWLSSIGTEIARARKERDNHAKDPAQQVRDAVKYYYDGLGTDAISGTNIDDCTMSELLELLQKLPDWEDLSKYLANLDVNEEEEDEADIEF